jgi:PAS domain S-box-containing protein
MAEPLKSLSGERRFQLLVGAVADYAIYMMDTEGRVVSWNAGAQRLKGYTEAEIVGQNFSRFFTPEDRREGLPKRALAEAAARGRFEVEGWRVRKDGGRFWALEVIEPILDEGGQLIGFAKITRDMTERQAAEEALRDSERRFRILVEGITDYAICMLDPSGVITSWNTGAERISGYRASEIVGRHFSGFYDAADRAAGLPAMALGEAQREGRFESEGWRLRKDGSRFWAQSTLSAIRDQGAELIGFAQITRDITERRAAQQALMESERQFRLLIGGMTDYALYMLDPNGVVTSWNVGAERIKGYRADEIIGQHFSKFYTDADRWAGAPARALNVAAETGKQESEGWRVRKDGTLFWASTSIEAIHGETGALVGFAKITRDITERRQAQIELEKAQEQLAQAQKMEALGQLTGGVAHDFNNLLMIISGHADLLKRRLAEDPQSLKGADAIALAVQGGETLTRQLLSFARRQRLNPRPVDIGQRMGAFSQMLASSLGAALKLQASIPPDTWPVHVDPGELELALVNITVNARDAMPDGGVLTLTAENLRLSRMDTDAGIEGDFVALIAADTGVGIPPDILQRVFDPFFSTKQAGKGTGLGLSQVHGFAHQSGGAVSISSEVGHGTVITLFLPRAKEAPAVAESQSEGAEAPRATPGRVLVVEDNPEVAAVTCSLLEQLGYQATAVPSADAALDLLGAGGQFDLVFSDIVMAGATDGLGLARALKETQPDLPVLLATGFTSAAEAARGDFAILRKPYQLGELGAAVSRAMQAAKPAGDNLLPFALPKGRPSKPRRK